jgi:RimJ/RimL family protein N-acetyltransferase
LNKIQNAEPTAATAGEDLAVINSTTLPLAALSLRSNIVTIGPVLPGDTGALFLWLNDVESANLDLAFRPVDWMGYNAWLTDFSKDSSQVLFAVRLVSQPKIIGFIMFKNIQPVHRWAELGARIGYDADRGKGFGTDAIKLALRYAWNHLNLNRVQLSVFANNNRAIRAYKAAGFEVEGNRRQAAFINGDWVDVVLMAALHPPKPQLHSVAGGEG